MGGGGSSGGDYSGLRLSGSVAAIARHRVERVAVAALRERLRRFGVALPPDLPDSAQIALHSFGYTRGISLQFCQHFFAFVSGTSIIHAEAMAITADTPSAPIPFVLANTARVALLDQSVLEVERIEPATIAQSWGSEEALSPYPAAPAPMATTMATEPNRRATAILHALKHDFVAMPRLPGGRTHAWRPESKFDLVGELQALAYEVDSIFASERSLLRIKQPVFVIGDLHGNYRDLMCFATRFGLLHSADFTPATFLCECNWLGLHPSFSFFLTSISLLCVVLGDYVDKGPHSLEVLAFLLAMKRLHPNKVYLLRGNHETYEINSGGMNNPSSLLEMCHEAAGDNQVKAACLFERCNDVFDRLPLAALIDGRIFCAHGGIPRFVVTAPDKDVLAEIEQIARPVDGEYLQSANPLAYDLLWNDPARLDLDPPSWRPALPPGFSPSHRGPEACCWGSEVARQFCEQTGCTHIIRAHEYSDMGLAVAHSGVVFTVFSSSGYSQGNRAAAIAINNHRLDIIMVDSSSQDAPSQVIHNAQDI
jgi:diadenosine tetraphosphatase ApaH/serine/threonine PP2A family protein phosphatase